MEAVVSLLILGILLTTIVSIIRFSMVLTGSSVSNATSAQELINDLTFEDFTGTPSAAATLHFSSTNIDIQAEHSVEYNTEDGIIAFVPTS